MLKFNDDNIYGGYIKQLLKSFNLPQCPIGKKDFLSSTHYIDGAFLYYYNKDNDTHALVSSYKENDKIENITKNLEIRNNLYDSYTHEYLGDYLRYIRDYKGLDLMSMYNCFSNVSLNNVKFEIYGSVFDSSSSDYTIFAIPIKYNRKYTIAIDWHGTIEMCCGFYSNNNLYKSYLNQGDLVVERATYFKVNGARFNHPFIFEKALTGSFNRDYAHEENFKLFLKVPTICKSSIVVLEGDYLQNAEFILDNRSIIISREDDEYLNLEDYNYLNKPQLLSMNYQTTYFIADRLVEYLSNNVITPIDPVIDNIRRLQRKLKLEDDISYTYYGIWDNKLRNYLYAYCVDIGNVNNYYDVLGYLDKNVEYTNRYHTLDIEVIDHEDGTKEENDVWLIR